MCDSKQDYVGSEEQSNQTDVEEVVQSAQVAVKKGALKRSMIWDHFTKLDSSHAVCNLCNSTFSYKTTVTNLKKHYFRHNKERKGTPYLKLSRSPAKDPIIGHGDHLDEFMKIKRTAPVTRTRSDFEDDWDTVTRLWAGELRHMAPRQRLFARKAINEILLEGQLGTLHRNSFQITLVGEPGSLDGAAQEHGYYASGSTIFIQEAEAEATPEQSH